MAKKFKELNKILQIILLAIPVCGYVVEVVLRVFAVVKKASLVNIIMLIICALGPGAIIGWIDLVLVPILGGDFLLMEE